MTKQVETLQKSLEEAKRKSRASSRANSRLRVAKNNERRKTTQIVFNKSLKFGENKEIPSSSDSDESKERPSNDIPVSLLEPIKENQK